MIDDRRYYTLAGYRDESWIFTVTGAGDETQIEIPTCDRDMTLPTHPGQAELLEKLEPGNAEREVELARRAVEVERVTRYGDRVAGLGPALEAMNEGGDVRITFELPQPLVAGAAPVWRTMVTVGREAVRPEVWHVGAWEYRDARCDPASAALRPWLAQAAADVRESLGTFEMDARSAESFVLAFANAASDVIEVRTTVRRVRL